MVLQILTMSAALGVATFCVGMLPLSFAFSKDHLERLSVLGTGLLLGAALGVIIPEGIEATIEANPGKPPTGSIALSLVSGFTVMLIMEQLFSPNSPSHPTPAQKGQHNPSNIEFESELGDLDQTGAATGNAATSISRIPLDSNSGKDRALALLLGLAIHASADGFALGVANLENTLTGKSSAIPVVVFLALIIHKAPTSVAFTTSLLSTNLSRSYCKKYLAIFSACTPLSAIGSYLAFLYLGRDKGDLMGTALLISGGTFLYIATVLQPVSSHAPLPGDMKPAPRVLFITIGMFIPLLLSSLFGHGH
jgi:zinc transporter 9